MNAQQQELFDMAILRVLDANRTRFGLTEPNIRVLMSEFGFPKAQEIAVLDRIDYLAGKELVVEVPKTVDAANRCWRLTPAGFAFVDEHS